MKEKFRFTLICDRELVHGLQMIVTFTNGKATNVQYRKTFKYGPDWANTDPKDVPLDDEGQLRFVLQPENLFPYVECMIPERWVLTARRVGGEEICRVTSRFNTPAQACHEIQHAVMEAVCGPSEPVWVRMRDFKVLKYQLWFYGGHGKPIGSTKIALELRDGANHRLTWAHCNDDSGLFETDQCERVTNAKSLSRLLTKCVLFPASVKTDQKWLVRMFHGCGCESGSHVIELKPALSSATRFPGDVCHTIQSLMELEIERYQR